jgi:hypothetical protein
VRGEPCAAPDAFLIDWFENEIVHAESAHFTRCLTSRVDRACYFFQCHRCGFCRAAVAMFQRVSRIRRRAFGWDSNIKKTPFPLRVR